MAPKVPPKPQPKSKAAKKPASLADLTALAGADLIRRGEISSQELVTACLERIAEREAEIGAWIHIDREHALAQASAADATKREGRGVGALHGVPVGIKDIIDTADMPTQYGCAFFKGRRATQDAVCITEMKGAGAIVLGKTVTTELASRSPGKTRNPHNLAHTPGGSSSGSAAAVASGMVPMALGTQTAGSVIRPASFCGIFAIKPTLGLISRRGALLQSHTLDTVGVYGRSVEDLALGLDVMGAQDGSDPVSYPRSRASHLDIAREAPPVPPLFAFCPTPAWDKVDQTARQALGELVEALGARCERIDLPSLEGVTQAQVVVMNAENAHYYGPLLDKAGAGITAPLRERLQEAAKIPARTYLDALNKRELYYAAIERVLLDYTALIVPAALGAAPKGLEWTGDPLCNAPWTYLGVPCVSLPLLEVNGLPYGVQLVGARRDDGRLLRTAKWLVEHLRKSG